MTHNAEQQEGLIRQAVAGAKAPIGLFVGAGCPVSVKIPGATPYPLIPDVAGLTTVVSEKLTSRDKWRAPLESIKDQLRSDGIKTPNVEDILTHVRALKQAAGRREVCGMTGSTLGDLDAEISRLIVDTVRVNLPDQDTPYRQLAAWIASEQRDRPVEVFTTNYDLLLEQALEATRVPYFDGFVGAIEPFFDLSAIELDVLPARWARLWKLHGSISWFQTDEGKRVVRRAPKDGDSFANVLIHPSHLKYEDSRRMPYLAMIDRLRAFLKQSPATLISIGYSFRDQHINEVLLQELQANPRSTCFGLLHGGIESYALAVRCGERRPNLSILAKDGAVIGTQQDSWEAVEKYPDGNGPSPAVFKLGDFARLGELLRSETRHHGDEG